MMAMAMAKRCHWASSVPAEYSARELTRIEQRPGKAPLRRANHNTPTNWPIMITAIATTSILS
jgi:hypothetical protein